MSLYAHTTRWIYRNRRYSIDKKEEKKEDKDNEEKREVE